MSHRIAVIGAGWYGCHISAALLALGFDVTVFEQHDRPLHEASGNNQFRLHQGFHYPRHHGTRVQSRDGFNRFIERYPSLSREVPENIYAVPFEDSDIDFLTYRLIMTSSGIDFRETNDISIKLTRVEGLLLVNERVLLINKAREFFTKRLGSALILNHKVKSIVERTKTVLVEGREYDLLIDATWGHNSRLPHRCFYEPTMLLYYETDTEFPAVTLVDGALGSLYPTEDPHIFTLSSVPHTPLGRFGSAAKARAVKDSVTKDLVRAKQVAMEEQIGRYIPDFAGHFRFIGPQLAIKTKPVGSSADRSCYVFQQGRTFHVLSGKIDTIFFAMERILAFLESEGDQPAPTAASPLRDDILRVAAG